ncbi:MAG: 50S ribosomal protein L18 [Nanoarchaeota archaeon]|nr:50S ribosomal protein L18 [Nanoarchaeota archaeon]|tara:strand:+ start:9331 stop:9753 length:423 start_codon:yes stop_codon:yes gene_type:complete
MRRVHKLVPYRRKRDRKTNYKKRLRLLLGGKPRLVVRITNTKIIAQIVKWDPKGDVVVAGVDSTVLKKDKWEGSFKNVKAAYKTGMIIAEKAAQKGVEEVILDAGFKQLRKGNRLSSFLKGTLDGGLQVPHSEKILPGGE